VTVAPGARWLTKKWPAEFFASVMQSIAQRDPGLKFLLAGTSDEIADAKAILAQCGDLPVASVCGGTTVGELLEVIRMSVLTVCNDSGPMHIAAALGVPVVAMFGPTDPALTGPYCEKKSVFIPEIACNRCFLRYCKDSRCHASIDPEAVAEASFKLLMERN
jgi:ADP-heptose:LPS heptosyltransferase